MDASTPRAPWERQAIALISLVSGFVAAYLAMVKMGVFGPPACGAGHGCEIAWYSSYGQFLGVDVALIGAVGYALVFAVALVGTFTAFERARWVTWVLAGLVYPAVLFTVRLKYGEWVVLRTFCPWCAVSMVAITLNAVLVTRALRRGS